MLTGHTIALKDGSGNTAPSPERTVSDSPDEAGLGGVTTEEYEKLL